MRLTKNQVIELSERYDIESKGTKDEKYEKELVSWFADHKYLDREHLIRLGLWKSARVIKQYSHELNTDKRVKELTAFSLASKDEYVRIMVPQIIRGVSWGVASVILHFTYPNEYMIIDFRAVWSLGWEDPKQYSFDYWIKYTNKVRKIAKDFDISLRTLDKALWQYSKENQRNQ